ncbi:MAG: two-component system histidine kinase PnpS [Nitrospirota bacterium]
MKRVLFRRILLAYLIIVPLLLISLELYLSRVIKDSYISKLRESLIIQARLIAEQIPSSFIDDLDQFCKGFKEKTGARVTIIDSSGRVLGDSDQTSKRMENHSNRPEIKDADVSGVGSSIRFSKTIRRNSFYLAITINQDSDKKFLRLSASLHDIETAINKIRIKIISASIITFLIIVVIGLFQTERITKSIEEITAFSKDIRAGNFKRRLFMKKKGELGELAKNITNMAQELNKRLTQSEKEKNKIEAILRNMSDGLILTDTKGRIILSNSAIMNLFGIESNIEEGRTVMETLRKAELIEVTSNVLESREAVSLELEVTHPKNVYLMVTAAPFFIKENISGVVLTFHDITRLKKLEDIRKDFVANVSHEIKTPITAIKGFAETLLEGAINDKENAYKFLETIKNHSERLNTLVNDLLTLSRIELGDIKIEKTNVDLNEVVDAVFGTLKDKALVKGLYLKKDISPTINKMKADRDRLIQILLNLVDNGIKFTEEGGVTVKVQIPPYPPFTKGGRGGISDSSPGDFVEISVEDTGTGIPKKHLARLGERFYRVDRARSRELGGTGLGLAIVKHLVKAHGWEMRIESTEGHGTIVHLLCPVSQLYT